MDTNNNLNKIQVQSMNSLTIDVDEMPTCSICLEEITDDGCQMPCLHHFHVQCIFQNLKYKNMTCPNCKQVFNSSTIRQQIMPVSFRVVQPVPAPIIPLPIILPPIIPPPPLALPPPVVNPLNLQANISVGDLADLREQLRQSQLRNLQLTNQLRIQENKQIDMHEWFERKERQFLTLIEDFRLGNKQMGANQIQHKAKMKNLRQKNSELQQLILSHEQTIKQLTLKNDSIKIDAQNVKRRYYEETQYYEKVKSQTKSGFQAIAKFRDQMKQNNLSAEEMVRSLYDIALFKELQRKNLQIKVQSLSNQQSYKPIYNPNIKMFGQTSPL